MFTFSELFKVHEVHITFMHGQLLDMYISLQRNNTWISISCINNYIQMFIV